VRLAEIWRANRILRISRLGGSGKAAWATLDAHVQPLKIFVRLREPILDRIPAGLHGPGFARLRGSTDVLLCERRLPAQLPDTA